MVKKIAIISEHASPLAVLGGVDSGGQNVYVGQLAAWLSRMGYAVDVFTRKDNKKQPEAIVCEAGYRVISVPAGPPAYVSKENLLPYMGEFSDYMVKFCKNEEPYLIQHANFFMSGLAALNVRKALGTPFVVTFHALGKIRRLYQKEADKFPESRIEIEQSVIDSAAGIIAECPQDKADLVAMYGAEENKIRVIPCGFDPQELSPVEKSAARAEAGFAEGEKIVLVLGRLVPRKGVESAVRGFAQFVKRHHFKAKLAIVGGETRQPDSAKTPEIARLASIAEEEGVADMVVFKGQARRDELKFYYSAAEVFITTPWYEPFGITPLEAMACGTPVIGSNVGGIKFSVRNGETGFLVAPNDPKALSDAIAFVFRAPEIRNYLSLNSVLRAHTLFTWKRISGIVTRFYDEAIAMAQRGAEMPDVTIDG